jgi:hypothetical protein
MSAAIDVAIFCGSPEWTDRDRIRRDLESLPARSVVIEGGTPGAARIAREEAWKLGFYVATVSGRFDRYIDIGNWRRNEAMARLRPGLVYAYPLDDPVTRHMIETAKSEVLPTLRIPVIER